MMIEEQPVVQIEPSQLVSKVEELKKSGHRLIQVSATTLADKFEITYSFESGQKFTSLRLYLPRNGAVVPSITGVYFGAFTYENELQDLFGVKVTDLKLDFGGKFYMLAKKTPFNETKAEAEAAAKATAPTPTPAPEVK